MAPEIVDAWMQHPSRELLDQLMFESLRRPAHGTFAPGELPLEWTVKAKDEAGVSIGILCAWSGPSDLLFRTIWSPNACDTLRTGS
jgi:uncharacterized protein